MARGKVRSQAHIIDAKAIDFVKRQLPIEWVVRELSPDYGIDLDVELFAFENDQMVTLGEHILLQVKGIEHPKYRNIVSTTENGTYSEKHLCFSLDTALLQLVERVGGSVPILLVTVDLSTNKAYFVCLNDYVDYVLCNDSVWREQKHKMIYVPLHNQLCCEKMLRWYGLRGKLLSFFCETKALESKMMYWTDAGRYVSTVVSYAKKIHKCDVWNTIELGFGFLLKAKHIVDDITENGISRDTKPLFKDDNEETLYENGRFRDMTAQQVRQVMTCNELLQSIDTANYALQDDLRQLYIPTEYNAAMRLCAEKETTD